MSTTRDALVGKLARLVSDYAVDVVAYSRKLTNLERPAVLVRVDKVRNSKAARGWREFDVTLILAIPQTDPTGPADDVLDGHLEDLLDILDAADADELGVKWTEATRSVLDEAFPAYEITGTATTRRSTTP